MGEGQIGFIVGFALAGIGVFLVTAQTIWMPRLKHLQLERNIWRNRALIAEDNATPNEPDIRLVGEWGSAIDGWVEEDQ